MAFTVNFRIVIEFCACKHENVKITRLVTITQNTGDFLSDVSRNFVNQESVNIPSSRLSLNLLTWPI